MYDNAEEAEHRLGHTVILYDGKPVYINNIYPYNPANGKEPGIYLETYQLPAMAKADMLPLADPKFEYHSMRLGYVNGKNNAVYLSRMPVRKFKQGLNDDNVSVLHLPGVAGEAQPRIRFTNLMKTVGLVHMCAGEYPSFEKVLRSLQGDNDIVSQAFDRQLALGKDGLGMFNLFYRGERVAFTEDGKVFKTSADYSYLKEFMAENGIKFVEKGNAA